MAAGADVSPKLSERFPDSSVLTGLLGQLKDGMGGVKAPDIPGDGIQSLTTALQLPIPDTSTWHGAIPDDAKNLTSSFPDASTLGAPLTQPMSKVSDVLSFDFSKFQTNVSTPPPGSASGGSAAATAAPDVASTLQALSGPLADVAKLLADPELSRVLEVFGNLTGSAVPGQIAKKAEEAASQAKTILHDDVQAFALAFVSLLTTHSSEEILKARVAAATGTFSLPDTQARLQTVLDQYGGATTLEALVTSTDASDANAVGALRDRLNTIAAAFGGYTGRLVQDLAITEAALSMLDVSDLQQQWTSMQKTLATIDWSGANSVANNVNTQIQSVKNRLTIDTGFTIDQYHQELQSGIARLNTLIGGFNVSSIVDAIQSFFKVLLSPLQKLEDFKAQVETIIRGALGTIHDAIQKINLKPLVDTVNQALVALSNSLTQVAKLLNDLRNAIQGVLETVKTALDGLRTFVLDPQNGLKNKIEGVFHSITAILDELKIQDVVNEIKSLLTPINDALSKIEFQPVIKAVLQAISTITDVLKTVAPLLVTDSLKQKLAEAAAFLNQIDFGKIGDTLNGTFDQILASVDQDALGEFQAEYQKVVDGLKNFDPEPALQEVQKDVFEPLLDELNKVHPADLLKPVNDAFAAAHAAMAKFNPSDTFSFMTDFFKDLLAKIDEISPAKLLAPIEKMLDDLSARINSLLHLDMIVAAFQQIKTWLQANVANLDLFGPVLAAIEPGFTQLRAAIENFDGSVFTKVIANLLDGALSKLGAIVNTAGLSAALATIVAGPADLTAGLNAIQQRMNDGSSKLAALDAQGALNSLRSSYTPVRTAFSSRSGAALPDDIGSLITALDPMPVIAPLLPKIDRVKATGAAKAAQFAQLSAPLADVLRSLGPALTLLHTMVTPLSLARDAMIAPLQGLFPGRQFSGPKEVILFFIDQLNPTGLQPLLEPLFTTLNTKLKVFLDDAVLNPIGEAVQTLKGITDVLNIHPVIDAVTGVFNDVENVVKSLDPSPIVASINADYQKIVAMLDQVNPAQFIEEIAKIYNDEIIGVVQGISPEALLLPPLRELFQKVSSDLGAFDIQAIFKPVLDRLKALDNDLGGGMKEVERAWTQMLGVLSSTTGGSASASVSVSA
jgi:hypothetical protein